MEGVKNLLIRQRCKRSSILKFLLASVCYAGLNFTRPPRYLPSRRANECASRTACWMKFETGQTSSNNFQQVATTHNMVCKRSQHCWSCWPTMLRAFARAFIKSGSWCLKARANARNMLRATLLGPTCCEHLHTIVRCCVLLRLVATCWMKFETGQTSSNTFQQVATTRNNTQHGVQTLATCWAQ